MLKQKKMDSTLFFLKTNDFLNLYLPEQSVRSGHTIKAYRDSLTAYERNRKNERNHKTGRFRCIVVGTSSDKMGTRDRTIMILMYDSAIRISEL